MTTVSSAARTRRAPSYGFARAGRRALFGLALLAGACTGPAAEPASTRDDPAARHSMRGSIPSAPGVSVRIAGPVDRTAVTGPDGTFVVPELPPGEYSVTPTQPGYSFTPVERRVTLADTDVGSIAFTRLVPQEGLSEVQLRHVDTLPDTWHAEEEVVLPNGDRLSDYARERGISVDSATPQ